MPEVFWQNLSVAQTDIALTRKPCDLGDTAVIDAATILCFYPLQLSWVVISM